MGANWLKGNVSISNNFNIKVLKIIDEKCNKVANSFVFRHYCDESLINKYRQLLNHTDGYLRNVVEMMRGSIIRSEVSKSMSDLLWTQLGRIEMELLGSKPAEVDEEKDE